MTEVVIRPYSPADLDRCYEICLRTGDDGRDATEQYTDPRLLGEVWVGPYLERWPQHAFVAADGKGVGGYIVGAADTVEHEAWLEREWLPGLRELYPIDAFPPESADAAAVHLLHEPPRAISEVAAAWPAHLHIDVLPGLQRRGHGTALMDAFLQSLSAVGVPAVHLGVSDQNQDAIAFYRRLGFRDIRGGTIWGRSTDAG